MLVRGALAALLLSAFSSACSPASARHELADAQHALTQAEQHGAGRAAMYEHAAAVAYLQKAREEDSHAEFEAARTYAKRSVEFSKKAETRAMSVRDGLGYRQPEPTPPPPSAVPAMPANDAEFAPVKRRTGGAK